MRRMNKPRLLLHCCCAPCLITAIDRLKNYEIIVFFFNPNIHPYEEYKKRLENARNYCNLNSIKFYEGEYDIDLWFKEIKKIKDYDKEPEGGKRCSACFKVRLKKTADFALSKNIKFISTTLTLGENKNSKLINRVGKNLAEEKGINFVEINLKKQEGFKFSVKKCKECNIYRQNYCGCVFSIRLSK
ncbi:MAG: epoxyqueuosine reductase QueH [Candidatus Woesearchaeota archaeon]